MSSYQTLMAIGSIFLLSLLIFNYYRTNTEQTMMSVDNEAIITATGIAQSIIDNIQTRAFDEFTTAAYTNSADSLTLANNLGPDAGESIITQFDDVDDFNGIATVDTTTRLGDYDIDIDVYYISNLSPSTVSFTRTFAKRIDVTVMNDYLKDTLRLSHVVSY
ncbi:MAG: hypothetical protein JW995_11885 [Melioribacteraceae bacterium]|nr:hypothetical protein [Melioribacteraceae bacterium]